MPLLSCLKTAGLRFLKHSGVFRMVRQSSWRTDRLLILCYHGVSLDDEHQWRPALYLAPGTFRSRMEVLKRQRANVLSLADGIRRLYSGALPPRSVAITFDDGLYDFYRQAYPVLRTLGFPAAVYWATQYSDYRMPVFNLISSYLLWRGRGRVIPGKTLDLESALDLTSSHGIRAAENLLVEMVERRDLSLPERDAYVRALARLLEIDYDKILESRLLQVMGPAEVREVAAGGVDIQLHTHRHLAPRDEDTFRKEIRDNRRQIMACTGLNPTHFCYPSGVYQPEFPAWLRSESVVSATVCDAGLATPQSDPFKLPRLLDGQHMNDIQIEAWVSGVGSLLSRRGAGWSGLR